MVTQKPPEQNQRLLAMSWAGRAGSSDTECLLLAVVPGLWGTGT